MVGRLFCLISGKGSFYILEDTFVKIDDEKRIGRKNLKELDRVMNDAVKVSRMLSKYDESSVIMSILGAAFSTWCDAHELTLAERQSLLRRLVELQE